MKTLQSTKHLIIGFIITCSLASCFHEEEYDNTNQGNFDALWNIIDQKYCFFQHKQVNWDSIRTQYTPYINEQISKYQLFDLMCLMLSELKDGHVNLSAPHDVGRYWNWKEDFPNNFDTELQEHYLGKDYRIAGGIKYTILPDNIGYIVYQQFTNAIGSGNLDEVLAYLSTCHGIIIDIRNNPGGLLTNSTKLAERFMHEKTLVGYIRHKTGKGHNDFSKPYPLYVGPSSRINFLTKPVALLTNRSCYSAANDFANIMQHSLNTFLVGDKTGGGSGLPFSAELPNGWVVRFSTSPMTNAQDQHTESGIEPQYKVDLSLQDQVKNIDTIIEKARQLIQEKSKEPTQQK